MAHIRTPKVAQACSRRPSAALGTRRAHACVVLASLKAADSSSWKPASDEPATASLDWVKPEFDLDSFCLKKEIRKFSKAAAGSISLPPVTEEVEVDRFSFKAPMHRKPDFTTIRPFWHELL